MKNLKLYRCKICGNLIAMFEDMGPVPMCCNTQMRPVNANTVDAVVEKHVPVIYQDGNYVTVRVGEIHHPMGADHYIKWIILLTDTGGHSKELFPGMDPTAEFVLDPAENVIAAYAYCNLHGLWTSNS